MRIGFSACYFHSDPKRPVFKGKTLLYLEQSMSNWVLSQGVLGFMIPSEPSQGTKLKDLVNELDGLILQGGSDVAPESYGETSLKPEWKGDRVRDLYEIALVKEFMKQEKPVLGICRGLQLLNVALGGTLYQDIETQVPGALNHRNWEIYDQNFHEIECEKDSWLQKWYGGKKAHKVNTVHHQAIQKLAPGLVTEAISPKDSIIEAVRYEGKPFVYAVQWHPEFHDPKDSSLMDSTPLLKAFLKECS